MEPVAAACVPPVFVPAVVPLPGDGLSLTNAFVISVPSISFTFGRLTLLDDDESYCRSRGLSLASCSRSMGRFSPVTRLFKISPSSAPWVHLHVSS